MPEMGTWAKKITIHQLLTHTSGMGDTPSLVGKPGKQFIYSNAGYDLLGRITARMESTTFPEQVRNMARMCQMKNTFANEKGDVFFLKSLYPQFVPGWREDKKGKFTQKFVQKDESQNPSLGIVSTPEDMMKWSKCLHGGDLLSPGSYEKMITPFVRMPHRWGVDMKYGYGLQIEKTFGSVEISHNSSVPGFKASMIYYPQEQVHVVIMENISLNSSNQKREFGIHDRIRKVVIDHILTRPVEY
jgi:CubicO group peptidase (beta-lactamase class C family)